MTKLQNLASIWLLLAGAAGPLRAAGTAAAADGCVRGRPAIQSMSALAFGPPGVLFVGDGTGGAVFALDLGTPAPAAEAGSFDVQDLEAKIAARLGTTADEVLIHDLAVEPVSRQVYLAVSRGRGKWDSAWLLPNDLADARVLLRVAGDGAIREVPLDDVRFARVALPNPIDPAKAHEWKTGISMRTETITDLAFEGGKLWVAGLSNEEFSAAMWQIPYPFGGAASSTTLEIFHGAHGVWETKSPIRTFVPYTLDGEASLLAAFLCTPLVTFSSASLQDGKHVRGRTVAEFGAGNYPLDMLAYETNGERRLLIANSNLPLMIVRAADVERFDGQIDAEVAGYMAGVAYEPRSGTGVQQLDRLDAERFIAVQRLPSGRLDLVTLPVRRF